MFRRTSDFDDVTLERDDAVPRGPVRDSRRLVQVVGDERVAQREVERRQHALVFHFHQVEQSRDIFWAEIE